MKNGAANGPAMPVCAGKAEDGGAQRSPKNESTATTTTTRPTM
jgi:hypothetical protein